jgi:hypothetical protein
VVALLPSFVEADSSFNQEGLLSDYVQAFDETRWHGPDITLLLFTSEIYTLEAVNFGDGVTAEMHAEFSLRTCRGLLPPLEAFEPEAETLDPGTVPPNLNLKIYAYALSPYLDGCVPLFAIWHDSGTHRYDFSAEQLADHYEEMLWLSHFKCIEYAPEAASLAAGTESVMMLDFDSDADSDFAPDSDETSSTTDSESGISDSFRRSPTLF